MSALSTANEGSQTPADHPTVFKATGRQRRRSDEPEKKARIGDTLPSETAECAEESTSTWLDYFLDHPVDSVELKTHNLSNPYQITNHLLRSTEPIVSPEDLNIKDATQLWELLQTSQWERDELLPTLPKLLLTEKGLLLIQMLQTMRDVLITDAVPGQAHHLVRNAMAFHLWRLIHANVRRRQLGFPRGWTFLDTVLMFPSRHAALMFMEAFTGMISRIGVKRVVHHNRFRSEFGISKDESKELIRKHKNRPADFRARFTGNGDDRFFVPVKFDHSKSELVLFAPLKDADFVITSPLKLKTVLLEDENAVNWFASVSCVFIDQADHILMQNWTHLCDVVDSLSLSPISVPDGTDVLALRPCFIEEKQLLYRQVIINSSLDFPELNAFIRSCMFSHQGCLALYARKIVPALKFIEPPVSIRFLKLRVHRHEDLGQCRIVHFMNTFLRRLHREEKTIVVIPDHFDSINLEAQLRETALYFEPISEYDDLDDVMRVRTAFNQNRIPMLLVTERFHFYHRYFLRGATFVLFLSPPTFPSTFHEFLREASNAAVLFSKFDALSLSRILGTKQTNKLLTSPRDTTLITL